jgi:hypothetical protein
LPEDRLALVDARLNDADQLEAEGQRMQARKIWSSIVALYGDNRELQPQVERAQALLSGDAAPPDMANDAEPDDSEPPE